MRVSFVLRVDPEVLAVTGQPIGDIEEVETGRRVGVRLWEDIAAFCRTRAGEAPADAHYSAPPIPAAAVIDLTAAVPAPLASGEAPLASGETILRPPVERRADEPLTPEQHG